MSEIEEKESCIGVVTTINHPNDAMNILVDFSNKADTRVVIVGDTKTPLSWQDLDCEFLTIETQDRIFPDLAAVTPTRHYARKNFGYLSAIELGASWIYETDDDNFPTADPFTQRDLKITTSTFFASTRWLNIYEVFGHEKTLNGPQRLWPRGFDLKSLGATITKAKESFVISPLQQGLANGDPDVDAIYRLILGNLVNFNSRGPVSLQHGQISPINSQTTWWHKSIFQLMYLPSTCTFRLTDILRGFIAWRILLDTDMVISFFEPIVRQDRNEHDLLKDFKDEIELFYGSNEIVESLLKVQLKELDYSKALVACYSVLVTHGVVNMNELTILAQWNKRFR